MKLKCYKAVGLLLCTAMVTVPVNVAAKSYTGQISYKRGFVLCWSRDTVTWTYNGSKIIASEGDQSAGGALFNDVEALGIKKRVTVSTKKRHVYRGKKKAKAGIIIGEQCLGFTTTINDDILVYSDGWSDVNRNVK